ncbi:carbohydrate kinase family protein [Actinokineospora sp. PR83]|uniref:carbohydrate kinase family protein n=1 Tax=Actinokineospora sp. PR83 TaxID=2884908 RepID=UPI001F21F388|nr:carbohydrate kinase family protein [Actinokineospora sp. PR83]MCG8919046.1 carbohydrate kinase family protein [Actinokineospora sp. PR83]
MADIVVAGVANVQMACPLTGGVAGLLSSRRLPGGLDVRVSGSGFTAARTARALGSRVALATYVGADRLGRVVEAELRAVGLHGPGARECDEQPRALVLYDDAGGRHNTTDLRSTPRLAYPATEFASLVDGHGCDLAVLGNIAFTRPLIPVLLERDIPFVTDVHLVDAVDSAHNRDWMATAHVLSCSHEGLPTTPGAWVRAVWSAHGTEVVVVGCGAGGAVVGVRAGRSVWRVRSSAPRGVRYTSGAGDTLVGAFAHHYAASGDPVDALRHAVLTAGWAVGGGPDEPRHPDAARLARLRARHGLPPVRRLA